MTYKDTVIDLFERYPSICRNRLEIDDHLFAVIGNGYHWDGGQLVEEYYSEDEGGIVSKVEYESKFDNKFEKYSERYNEYTYPKKMQIGKKHKKMISDYIENFKKEHSLIDLLKGEHNEYHKLCREFIDGDSYVDDTNFKIYDICNYSRMMNIPDDVQNDWLDAIEHFIDFLLEHNEFIDVRYSNQIEQLNQCKNRILEIRKSR